MPEAIENYVPQNAVAFARRRAFFAWSGGVLLTAFWIFLILLAPLAKAHDSIGVSQPIYKFFSYLCHQMPERSLHLETFPLAVCSRCFGVYFGLFFGVAIYPLLRPIQSIEPLPRVWLFLAMIPIIADWSLGFFEIWNNTHLSRFLTGAILGFACAIFIVPALVELFQILAEKFNVKRLPT